MVRSICSYWPSPSCWNTIFPLLSTMYCAGPVLGSILTVVATSRETAWASAQLVVYTIGAAIPMLAIAYGGQAVSTRVRSLAAISARLQQGFGAIVIAFALLSYFQYDTLIVAWLTAFYPNGQTGL